MSITPRDGNNRTAVPHAAAFVLTALLLSACAEERPQLTVSPKLESGVTSSNGGGARTLGNQPDVGFTTRVGPQVRP